MIRERSPRAAQTTGDTTAKEGDMTSLRDTLEHDVDALLADLDMPPACELPRHGIAPEIHAGDASVWILTHHAHVLGRDRLAHVCARFVEAIIALSPARCDDCGVTMQWSDLLTIVEVD